ncbi:hypothetical protein N9L42_03765 [Flavobacteriaceae bacterium]|nr:hypothetical protein [Flavobacteriaceae bacterium]MDA9041716.1 hypothetical protein [Flavobacteriaceae bacterium]MDA9083906.1 hypothetical protein [Flavobacteriaceae bacterium]MDA9276083.1 hypothetical protein [Flavobacteriaceae bacterium]MDC0560095.1 hypothetical protein [Flavobacteriaceae bacterium]|tara:strand:+ start:750 stop:1205 length:456 start_codon:yes stop_codon:yes gene_type:complete
MKNIILVLALIFISNIQSQENNRNDLIGEWEFKIDVKDVIKNSDDLNGFEKLAARAFSGIIEEALNKTQILIDFKKNNTAAIIITTGEKTESKVVFSWEIDQKGYLILDATYDQTEVQFGDTAYWVFDDDKLVPYDIKANINKGMLLIKVR